MVFLYHYISIHMQYTVLFNAMKWHFLNEKLCYFSFVSLEFFWYEKSNSVCSFIF